jgi:hypothetical protein
MFKQLKTIPVFLIILLFSLFSCGEDKIVVPEPEPEPAIKLPELMPLAKGATWKYDLCYRTYRGLGTEYYFIYEEHFGKFELNVVNEERLIDTIKYSVETHFTIEKSILSHNFIDSHGTDTLFNTLDTTLVYTIVLAKDTLWYSEKDSLKYMMPRTFIPGGDLNLKIYSCSRSKPPNLSVFSSFENGISTAYYFVYNYNYPDYYEEKVSKKLIIDKKCGIFSIYCLYDSGGHNYTYGSIIEYLLTEYVPGVPYI